MNLNRDRKNSEMDKFDKRFNYMFKLIFALFVCTLLAALVFWGSVIYVAVTKVPETVQRIERVTDAYADKLEQETKNQKKPE